MGTLVAAPIAGAATLTVDDDGADCPAAGFSTIQNAIFAARPGDTIAVCPGEYVEGGGGTSSNGLIIIRNVNIKGAGADLVTIKPRRTRANGGQIADTAATPDLRNATGAIVMINGADTQDGPNSDKDALLTVNISGVTIDGDGVYAEAGVLFRDAQGSISRSRITNVVTTETSYDTPRPGEYKGSSNGYAIASVTAPALTGDTVPRPGDPRVIQIDHTRIDKYNAAGVFLDGATNDTLPLTPSGIVSRGVFGQNQIVGRTLCVNFEVDGNCSNPQPANNGPLYGQDGVRITAGSSAAIVDTLISQNLVQGTGAPVRNSATNNANLTNGAGVRLIGAAASQIARSNIVDNAYGVFNAQLNGQDANTAIPVKAENNWWGLRGGAVQSNPGPQISPTTNPPTPENPVNGAPVQDGAGTTSDAVDFFPFRDGFQSDPNTGEFPVFDVPGPVNDAGPTVTLATDAATYHRGGKARLTASPADDFGVRRVVFYDGSAIVGTSSVRPYTITYTLPTDILCTSRTLTALVEDSAGQTASASKTVAVDPADCATPQPQPGPSISFVDPPLKLSAGGTRISSNPVAPAGVKSVEYYLGTSKRCTATAAPWACTVQPTGADVGVQVLRAVLTDATGKTAETSVRVEVPRFAPKGLALSRKGSKITASLQRPAAVTARQGCSSGTITLVSKRGGRVIDDTQLRLRGSCKVTRTIRPAKGKLSVSARFGGNTVLLPISKSRRFSR